MIKYGEIEGYANVGGIKAFSHVYQFIEKESKIPKVILVHAYECDTEVFKGYLAHNTKTFQNVDLKEEERDKIEGYCGKLTQVGFDKFIENTEFAKDHTEYREKEIVKQEGKK